MISPKRLVLTVATTSNFPTALLSRQNKKSVNMKFRNGLSLKLTWSQFVNFRDNYEAMSKFTISQIEDDLFRIKNDQLDITCNAIELGFLLRVSSEYTVEQTKEGLLKVKSDDFELVGSQVESGLILLVYEYLKGEYKCDCAGRVVLDIGGFQGETAVFFSLLGAKKVVLYEPVAAHQEFIKRNIETNRVDAEIHCEGIDLETGTRTFSYDEINAGLGLMCTGSKKMTIKVRNIAEVIDESGADIAKLDCEGAEESLVGVSTSTLRKVERYMIESHSEAIKKALIEKFTNAGFEVTRNIPYGSCALLWFERKAK